jgi:hypothetical protein
VRQHDDFRNSYYRDWLGADHHASDQFSGPLIRTHYTGDFLRGNRAGAKQRAGNETSGYQFKTKLAQNVSPDSITKAGPP